MTQLLAQADLGGVPASFLKWFVVVLVAIILVACAVIGAYVGLRGLRGGKTRIEPQPLEVRKSPKRYNHELMESRYEEVTRRLDKHDEEIKEIQKSRMTALEHINRRFERVLIGLTNIGARVGAKVPNEEEGEE